MKYNTLINIVMAIIFYLLWTFVSDLIGFERAVIVALATIYGTQK